MIPLLEAQEHVRPDDETEFGLRILRAQRGDRVIGIALSAASELDVADLGSGDPRKGQTAQLHTLFGRGAVLGKGLVRRGRGGDDQKAVGRERLHDALRRLDMSQVRRVEAASVNGDPHAFFRSFGSSIFGSFPLRR